MYECQICLTVNHSTRLHCGYCGCIPSQYSVLGRPAIVIHEQDISRFIPAVAAIGCVRACQHHAARVYLRTVETSYYAEC